MIYVADWARYFALTLGIELLVATPLLGRREALARRLAAVTFAQVASHPAVWFILPALGLGRIRYLVLAESWAIVSELLLYRLVFPSLTWSRALAASALANGVSLGVSTLIR
jgi:hypothetical protein